MPFYCNPPISDTDESQHAPLEQIWNWTWNLLNYFIGEPNPWVCFMLKGTHQKVLKFGTANLLPPSPKISIKLNALVFRIDSLPWPLFLRACFYQLLYFVLGRVQHLQWMGLHRVRRFQSSGPGCLWPGISWPGLAGCLWPVLSGAPSRQVAALGPSSRQPPIGQGN